MSLEYAKNTQMTWSTDAFVRILGVHVDNDYEHTKNFNIQPCIRQMEERA